MKGFTVLLIATLFVSCASSNNKAEQRKKRAHIYYTHGTKYLLEKEYIESLKNLLEAKKLDPDNSKILNNLGMAYYFRGKPELAKSEILESIKLDDKNSDARNNLASIYFQMGQYDKAQKQYEKVLANLIYSHQYRTHYNLGLIQERKGNITKAITHYERASGIKVDYCAANYRLALGYKKVGQVNKAKKSFKNSVRGECENEIVPFYEWANLLISLGQNQEAIEKINYIIKKFPTHKLSQLAARKKRIIEKKMALSINTNTSTKFQSGDF